AGVEQERLSARAAVLDVTPHLRGVRREGGTEQKSDQGEAAGKGFHAPRFSPPPRARKHAVAREPDRFSGWPRALGGRSIGSCPDACSPPFSPS
ncbi:MAG: hypothetical protein RJB55_925, partial [Verrucomicrobiota bacterium]